MNNSQSQRDSGRFQSRGSGPPAPPRRFLPLALASVLAVFLSAPSPSAAQNHVLFLDGERAEWPLVGAQAGESPGALDSLLVRHFATRGYWLATVDSIREVGSRSTTFYLSLGKASRVRRLKIAGVTRYDSARVALEFAVNPGAVYDQTVLQADIGRLLRRYAEDGLPLAAADVSTEIVDLGAGSEASAALVDVLVEVDEGTAVILSDVLVDAGVRTRAPLVARLGGLQMGRPVRTFDPEEVRSRLLASGLFVSVGEVSLATDHLGNAFLTVPLVERPPGSFDVVLGYLSNPQGGGSFVGNGHIVLQNLFGGAREFSLRLDRLSGRTSRLDARLEDPFVVGTAAGVALEFKGEQRDSTYSKQSYGVELAYRLTRSLKVLGAAGRDATRPGQAGLALVGGRQRVPRSTAVFAGIGVGYADVDRPENPRAGITFDTRYERGTKRTTTTVISGADTLAASEGRAQERLSAHARVYIPIGGVFVAASGVDARALLSSIYDEADLLRIGGANSLRGYNEEQFSGRFVARALTEFRVLIDRLTYAFAFADMGYIEGAPGFVDAGERTLLRLGFGVGVQFQAPVGLMNATYGMNTSDGPLNGKVHVGLSFDL